MTKPLRLGLVGFDKAIEEVGELLQVLGKIQAYGFTAEHPDGNGPLRDRLEQGMGDVLAAMDLLQLAHSLDDEFIEERRADKFELYCDWNAEGLQAVRDYENVYEEQP